MDRLALGDAASLMQAKTELAWHAMQQGKRLLLCWYREESVSMARSAVIGRDTAIGARTSIDQDTQVMLCILDAYRNQ